MHRLASSARVSLVASLALRVTWRSAQDDVPWRGATLALTLTLAAGSLTSADLAAQAKPDSAKAPSPGGSAARPRHPSPCTRCRTSSAPTAAPSR